MRRKELIEALSEKEKYESSLSSLEELKTKKDVSEEQYNSLKDEYEKRITESKVKIEQSKKYLELELGGKEAEKNTLENQRETLGAGVKVGEIGYDAYQKEKRKLDGQIERVESEIGNLKMLISTEKPSDIRGEIEAAAKSIEDLKPTQIDLSDVIVSPFRLLSEHRQLFAPLGIGVAIGIIMAIFGLGGSLCGITEPTKLHSAQMGMFIIGIVTSILLGWVCVMFREIKDENNTSVESSLAVLGDKIIPITIAAILVGAIVSIPLISSVIFSYLTIAGDIDPSTGSMFFIAFWISSIIISVALYCTIPAIIMHKSDVTNGLKASWRFCRTGKNFWMLFVMVLIAGVVSIIPTIGHPISSFILLLWIGYTYAEHGDRKYIEPHAFSEEEIKKSKNAMATLGILSFIILPICLGFQNFIILIPAEGVLSCDDFVYMLLIFLMFILPIVVGIIGGVGLIKRRKWGYYLSIIIALLLIILGEYVLGKVHLYLEYVPDEVGVAILFLIMGSLIPTTFACTLLWYLSKSETKAAFMKVD